jgi:cobalamin biosynthetic protein CobC
MEHRGATGAEPDTGDGAGILIQVPHRFLAAVAAEHGITLPAAGAYAVGMGFLTDIPVGLPGYHARIPRTAGTLPRLLPPGRVALAKPTYAEHPAAWRAAGHEIVAWHEPADYALCCRPNNPTGALLPRAQLIERAKRLRLIVIDEAFLDATAEETLINTADNVVVLRSLGKFWGLAGVRIGFVFAPAWLDEKLRSMLGPWAVAHPARWAATLALADTHWQAAQRARLAQASQRLAQLLAARGLANTGTALFRYAITPAAETIHLALARQGILVRHFADPPALRFGLPADEAQWRRLESALEETT